MTDAGSPTSNDLVFALSVAELIVPLLVAGFAGWLSGCWAARQQRERLKTELKLEFSTEAAIRELLSVSPEKYPERKRSFAAIKRRLAGFEDDELRRHLIRAGAVSFRKPGVRGDDGELWGLRELVPKEGIWEGDA